MPWMVYYLHSFSFIKIFKLRVDFNGLFNNPAPGVTKYAVWLSLNSCHARSCHTSDTQEGM